MLFITKKLYNLIVFIYYIYIIKWNNFLCKKINYKFSHKMLLCLEEIQ